MVSILKKSLFNNGRRRQRDLRRVGNTDNINNWHINWIIDDAEAQGLLHWRVENFYYTETPGNLTFVYIHIQEIFTFKKKWQ